MSSLFIRDSKFIYQDIAGERMLLNCNAFLENKSRISMHRFQYQLYQTIPELLISLIEREQKNGNNLEIPFGIIDILLTSQLIQTSQPVRMLEYGSGQGLLSCHLAELLGAFHEKSTLVCAYDTIEPEWMEQISQVDQLPKVSFFAGDFGDFQLQENFFDIVLVNGMINYTEPYQVISDALRLAKDDAVIFCYTNDTPFLENVFQLFFEHREEYEINSSNKVLMANIRDKSWNIRNIIDFSTQALEDIEYAKIICSQKVTEKKLCFSMIDTLTQDIKNASRMGDINLKLQLIDQKELLMEYILKRCTKAEL